MIYFFLPSGGSDSKMKDVNCSLVRIFQFSHKIAVQQDEKKNTKKKYNTQDKDRENSFWAEASL